MLLFVYMRDGRTVYRVKGRQKLMELMERAPFHEYPSVGVDRGIWNPHQGLYVWRLVNLRHISKGSISSVEEALGPDRYPVLVGPWEDS